MARAKRKRDDEGPQGAPEWIVTFTDMISLLVTFFVLLMTFSSLEENDVLKVDQWLKGNTGLLVNRGQFPVDVVEDDYSAATDVRRGAMHPHDRPAEELDQNLAEMGQRKRPGDLPVFMGDVADGLVIAFGDDALFAPGSIEVPPPLIKSLGEIGRVLKAYPHLVVVEGFSDADFQPTSRFPTPEEQAFARANACAEVMLRASGLPAERLQIVGRGVEGDSPDGAARQGRRQDPKVQIRVLTLSKLRASYEEGR